MAQQPLLNGAQHRFGFQQHLPIIEAQNREPGVSKHSRAFGIAHFRLGLEVLTAVEFDDQASFNANEVCDEACYGVLTTELAALQTPAAKVMPKHALSVG